MRLPPLAKSPPPSPPPTPPAPPRQLPPPAPSPPMMIGRHDCRRAVHRRRGCDARSARHAAGDARGGGAEAKLTPSSTRAAWAGCSTRRRSKRTLVPPRSPRRPRCFLHARRRLRRRRRRRRRPRRRARRQPAVVAVAASVAEPPPSPPPSPPPQPHAPPPRRAAVVERCRRDRSRPRRARLVLPRRDPPPCARGAGTRTSSDYSGSAPPTPWSPGWARRGDRARPCAPSTTARRRHRRAYRRHRSSSTHGPTRRRSHARSGSSPPAASRRPRRHSAASAPPSARAARPAAARSSSSSESRSRPPGRRPTSRLALRDSKWNNENIIISVRLHFARAAPRPAPRPRPRPLPPRAGGPLS